ncbi:hypothetical protein JHW45_09885 [Paracoccus stylophorae]|uniref:Lipoprotein n=1 Tax=Paracoccus stylophorae TaxID=659350 RepID=A0ABY7SQY6_9RHOB|nr:hypothetical protein [Paracoccus stylophorae]WCR09437.1 hypothetical protein JHW45_09885 [Paracoccus stylophorae]
MKRRHLILPALCAALAACAPAGTTTTQTATGWPIAPRVNPDDYMMRDAASLGLTGAEILPEAAAAIRTRLAGEPAAEGNAADTVNAYDAGDGTGAVVLTRSGLPDDSIRAEQHVVEFQLRPDPQVEGRVLAVPQAYGMRQQCYRAADPDAWTNQPCP